MVRRESRSTSVEFQSDMAHQYRDMDADIVCAALYCYSHCFAVDVTSFTISLGGLSGRC